MALHVTEKNAPLGTFGGHISPLSCSTALSMRPLCTLVHACTLLILLLDPEKVQSEERAVVMDNGQGTVFGDRPWAMGMNMN